MTSKEIYNSDLQAIFNSLSKNRTAVHNTSKYPGMMEISIDNTPYFFYSVDGPHEDAFYLSSMMIPLVTDDFLEIQEDGTFVCTNRKLLN